MWHLGYGGQATSNETARDKSYLKGIGQTTDSVTGIIGSTADEAYDKYEATGATPEQLAAFARRIAMKNGRSV